MKTQIRHNLLAARDGLSYKEVSSAEQSASALFFDSLFAELPDNSAVMLYAAFRNEMSTWLIIDTLFSMGKTVILPKTSGNDIIPYEYAGHSSLVKDAFGILTPDPSVCKEADFSQISAVIVPGVGFDRNGNRIGFGRGYYDRFLAKIPDALKIGFCYEFQIQPCIPVCETDIPMDFLLTEKALINCKK